MSTTKKQDKSTHGGKGSKRRTPTVSRQTYIDNYNRVYGPYAQIVSLIEGLRKKGLTDEDIETEVMKEHGTVVTIGDVRELME